jgi:hypothetical protein
MAPREPTPLTDTDVLLKMVKGERLHLCPPLVVGEHAPFVFWGPKHNRGNVTFIKGQGTYESGS